MTGGAEALRRAFDERFAAPAEERPGPGERLLLVGAGGARFALRIDEIAGIHAVTAIVRLPGGSPLLAGLAGIRGRVVPVFDLAALLGAAGAGPAQRRWIVLAGDGERVGLVVAEIGGHAEIDRAAIHAAGAPGGADAPRSPHVRAVAEVSGALVPVVSVPSIVAALATYARGGPAEGGP